METDLANSTSALKDTGILLKTKHADVTKHDDDLGKVYNLHIYYI